MSGGYLASLSKRGQMGARLPKKKEIHLHDNRLESTMH